MVDEYNHSFSFKPYYLGRSDSSMVDEYNTILQGFYPVYKVQIPLWSMNTRKPPGAGNESWPVQIPLWSMNTTQRDAKTGSGVGSDSSMVDEYCLIGRDLIKKTRSDSSMVDEYRNGDATNKLDWMFRFLYGRWILAKSKLDQGKSNVQIPLWSMNTLAIRGVNRRMKKFRFLYGRWILSQLSYSPPLVYKFRFLYGRWILLTQITVIIMNMSSDSSMVDEYRRFDMCHRNAHTFRFLYGRWIPKI